MLAGRKGKAQFQLLMWLVFNLLKYSLGSVLYGLLVALCCGMLVLMLSKAMGRGSQPSPIGLVAGMLMLIGVAFQAILFFVTQRLSTTIVDYEEQTMQIVRTGTASTQKTLGELKNQASILWYFISDKDYDDIPLSELPHTLASDVRSALSGYALRRVWWGIAFLLACGVSVLTLRHVRTAKSSYSNVSDYGFGDNSYDYDD